MKEMGERERKKISKGAVSDQINSGSLMQFVKQRRSPSLEVQSQLSNLVTDTIDLALCKGGERNPTFVPLIPEVQLLHFNLSPTQSGFKKKKQKKHSDTDSH